MSGTDLLMLVAIFVLLLQLVVLAAAETGINKITRVKAQSMVEENSTKATRALVRLVEKPENFINPLLVTVTALQTVQSALTTLVAGSLFGGIGIVIGIVFNVGLVFVIAEALPKTWAVLYPERAALATARPVRWLSRFLPLRWISQGLIGLVNVLIPGRGLKQGPFVSESELLGIVHAAAEDEVIEHEERELIQSIIEFGDTVAREVMVPRPDMVVVGAAETVSGTLDKAIEAGYSRLPAVGENIDEVVGVAYTKDIMRAEREGHGHESVAHYLRPGQFTPESKPVAILMREMQAGKYHLAFVVDEYGGIAGLITLEDCIEELVGEIVDEYDVEEAHVEQIDEGDVRVDGGLDIDALNAMLGTHVPNDDWDTVAGFVLGMLGHVPEEGERFEYEGHEFSVEKVEGLRIALVRVIRQPGWRAPDYGDDDERG